MRVILDADTPVQMLDVLRHVLRGHRVDHVHSIQWSSKKDIPLLRDVARRGYDVFVTNDSNQLNDPQETQAIKRSKLHHIRYTHRHSGLPGLALAIGSVVAAMPSVINDLVDENAQKLVHIRGLDPTARYSIVDPKKDPPRYWR